MVVRAAGPGFSSPGFSPLERPRIAVSADGTLAAVSESTRVVIVELPGGAGLAEVGLDTAAAANEVRWVGTPPRLVVVSRFATYTAVHLVDPHGPVKLAEVRLESPMRLLATVGAHALVVGATGAAVLTASDTHLTPYPFPARALPVAAGAAGGLFVVALPTMFEEWDPTSRMPRRRVRLPRPVAIAAIGGNDRLVWATTQQEPARIDVMPLVNRGQPKHHELPEPIASIEGQPQIDGHPRSDLVVCIGAETGRLYAVDLDGRTRLRVIGADGLDRVEAAALVIGRQASVVAAQARRPLAVVTLETRAPAPEPERAIAPTLVDEPRRSSLTDEPDPADAPARPAQPASAPGPMQRSLFSPTITPEPRGSWRDAVVTWARGVVAGASLRDPPRVPSPRVAVIDELATRLELADELVPALVLLYGAHLRGDHGVAPADVARAVNGRWDEALGRGELARLGIARLEGSRIVLADPLRAVLDERPPITGVLVGDAPALPLLAACVVVDGDELARVAERQVPLAGGAILAGHRGCDPHALVLEARARAAVPMLRMTIDSPVVQLAAIFVVADERHAAALCDTLGVSR